MSNVSQQGNVQHDLACLASPHIACAIPAASFPSFPITLNQEHLIRPMLNNSWKQYWSGQHRLVTFLPHLYGEAYCADPLNLTEARREAIRTGKGWPSYSELLAGQAFYKDDFHADLARSCGLLLKYEKAAQRLLDTERLDIALSKAVGGWLDELFAQLRLAVDAPRQEAVREIHRPLQQLKAARLSWYPRLFGYREVEGRLNFYRACTGNKEAQARIANECLTEACRYWDAATSQTAFDCALGWLRCSDGTSYRPQSSKILDGAVMAICGSLIRRNLACLRDADGKAGALFIQKLTTLDKYRRSPGEMSGLQDKAGAGQEAQPRKRTTRPNSRQAV